MSYRPRRRSAALAAILAMAAHAPFAMADDAGNWPVYSADAFNTNWNRNETIISPRNVARLTRAWSTFNDAQWRPEPPPTGFILEDALDLRFPASVVGVVAPPLVIDGTIYYIDSLGTMFARNARTGTITHTRRHWTTTLVDPDFTAQTPPVAPDLYYSAPVVDDGLIWIHSSLNGRLHAIRQIGGQEIDFDPATPGIQPYAITPGEILASNLGEPVIVTTPVANPALPGLRKLFITEVNVIINDAVEQGDQVGFVVAIDITDPRRPVEAWRTATIDIDPQTGKRYGSGVSAGSGLAVDRARHLIYGGTGQNTSRPYPGYPDPAAAPAGYVDRSDAIYAIDYRTGAFVWVNQLHVGDVFDLNNPTPAGPGSPPTDADVLSPPVLFTARTADGTRRDLVGCGSKGGLYRVVDRVTGETVWERWISKPTGLGGIQAGSAYADGVVYVAGFEGIDDGFSDANFDAPNSRFLNAFFATFSPVFWADVEDVSDDGLAITGMQTKVYALDAGTGEPLWSPPDTGLDHVVLKAGAALRHVSVANGLLYVTTSSGQLFVLNARNGRQLFTDQTLDLNQEFPLGLGKPHHASMNAGTVISNGMVYVPYGAQNNPSGGMLAYKIGPLE
ncbi:outer membrane protein assembly factor BamB family protein [Nitrogeniibacter aestuarii]|uniref:outer membrane protein assembly factor BamB family protein n=1 Tax=Nitrogeniibacter aestuarii TaxID=2815343 RepID=UPI001E3FF3AE|nr:PQQ-binding-like beta-propeller repeat protein [Nitrogeniibacter aestuarii]